MSNLTTVKLYIYDISFGLASSLGSTLLGMILNAFYEEYEILLMVFFLH